MNKTKAKIRYKANFFEIVEEGDHVICAVSKKKNIYRKFELLECRTTRGLLFTNRGKNPI